MASTIQNVSKGGNREQNSFILPIYFQLLLFHRITQQNARRTILPMCFMLHCETRAQTARALEFISHPLNTH